MAGKDPKDMTASELLRKAAIRETDKWGNITPQVKLFSALAGEDASMTDYVERGDLLRLLADKIDAEMAEARNESLLHGAMVWAKANGWPEFKTDEGFGEWLERCAYKKPVDDCNEPVQFGDEIELHYRGSGMDKGRLQEVAVNKGPAWMLSFTGVDRAREYRYDSECDVLKRPAPDALGADGLPIKAGETVYPIDGEWLDTPLEVLSVESLSVRVSLPSGKGWTMFSADRLTHTPPDTQERIDEGKGKSGTEYWRCIGFLCGDCPAEIDGKRPSDRYGVINCSIAQGMDIARRQRELDERTGGAE